MVPVGDLLGLLVQLAVEHLEHGSERVGRREQCGEVAEAGDDRVPVTAFQQAGEDLVLGEEARERREAGEGERADEEAGVGERERLAQAAHAVDVLHAAHGADHRAGSHEEHRLEEGVRHEVEHAGGVGAGRDGDHHVADLAHRGVGDDPLQVGLDDRHRRRHHEGDRADDHADGRGHLGELEERGAGAR